MKEYRHGAHAVFEIHLHLREIVYNNAGDSLGSRWPMDRSPALFSLSWKCRDQRVLRSTQPFAVIDLNSEGLFDIFVFRQQFRVVFLYHSDVISQPLSDFKNT